MISFLPIIFKLFFRAGFSLTIFMVFFHSQNLRIRANGSLQVPTIIRKSFQSMPLLSQCILVVFSQYSLQLASRYIFLLSPCIFRAYVVFDFITCVSFCTEINNAQQRKAEPFHCNFENVSKLIKMSSNQPIVVIDPVIGTLFPT